MCVHIVPCSYLIIKKSRAEFTKILLPVLCIIADVAALHMILAANLSFVSILYENFEIHLQSLFCKSLQINICHVPIHSAQPCGEVPHSTRRKEHTSQS